MTIIYYQLALDRTYTDADLTMLARAFRDENPTPMLTANIPPPPRPPLHSLNKTTLCDIISQSKIYGLLSEDGFTAIPSTTLGNSNPQNDSACEPRTVEGQTGLLSRHCPVWSIRNWRATQRPSFEVLRMYQCKCKGCNFQMKVVHVEGGIVCLQRCTNVNGVRTPVSHDK